MSATSREIFLGSRARLMRKADNLTAVCEPTVYLESVGSSTSHNPIGLHGTRIALLYCGLLKSLTGFVVYHISDKDCMESVRTSWVMSEPTDFLLYKTAFKPAQVSNCSPVWCAKGRRQICPCNRPWRPIGL
jgi:hypothetical protein